MVGRLLARKQSLVAALAAGSLFLALGAPAGATASATASDEQPEPPVVMPAACTPPIKCCRVCTSGKACGNSCIQESKVCHKGKGCACNASEGCAADP